MRAAMILGGVFMGTLAGLEVARQVSEKFRAAPHLLLLVFATVLALSASVTIPGGWWR